VRPLSLRPESDDIDIAGPLDSADIAAQPTGESWRTCLQTEDGVVASIMETADTEVCGWR